MRNKIGSFRTETGTQKSVFLNCVTTFGLKKNSHVAGLVQNEVTMEPLFLG